MVRNKLDKRIMDALNTMYSESENVFGIPNGFTFEDINAICKRITETGIVDTKKMRIFPMFYLPMERQEEIVKNAIKGLRSYWSWPRKTDFDASGNIIQDPEWDEYVKFREDIDEKLDSKKITRKEYNRLMDEAAEKYSMVKRSRDSEYVGFNIWNMSPTSNRDMMLSSLSEESCDKEFVEILSKELGKLSK